MENIIGAEAPKPLALRHEKEITAAWGAGCQPTVSVLCATYNHARFIEDAICGFLAQDTKFPFEVIIRDDASTDGTAEIVAKYARQYSSIIRPIFEEKNSYSKTSPLPVMMSVAKGEFFALCEGDDYWIDPKKLEKQVSVMEKRKEISLLTTMSFNVSNNIIESIHKTGGTRTYMFRRDFNYPTARQQYIYYGDTALKRLLGARGAIVTLPFISAVYRQHSGGVHSGIAGKDERLIAFRQGATKFWLVENFLDQNERLRAKVCLADAVNTIISGYEELNSDVKRRLIVTWVLGPEATKILVKMKFFIFKLARLVRPQKF